MRWWQASAISRPPPRAAPLIAATTGHAERLEPAQVRLDRLAHFSKIGAVRRPCRLHQQLEVAAGEEGLLRAGDDDAGDASSSAYSRSTAARHRRPVELVHRVGAGGRVVQGQGDDAVGVLVS